MPQSPVGFTPPNPGPISTPTSPMPPQRPIAQTPEPEQITAPPAPPTPPSAESSTPPAPMAPQKKKSHLKTIIGVIILVLTVAGAAAGFFLSQNSQDVRQQASAPPCSTYNGKPADCGNVDGCSYTGTQINCNTLPATTGACNNVGGCTFTPSTPESCNGQYIDSYTCKGINSNVDEMCTGQSESTCKSRSNVCNWVAIRKDCSTLDEVARETCSLSGCFISPGKQASCEGTFTDMTAGTCAGTPTAPADPPADPPAQPPTQPSGPTCSVNGVTQTIVTCRTYDCPGGLNWNGNECRTDVPYATGTGKDCPAPPSNCGQVDYYYGGGTFDEYCAHDLYPDCTPENPPDDGEGGRGGTPLVVGYLDTVTCYVVEGWACDFEYSGKVDVHFYWQKKDSVNADGTPKLEFMGATKADASCSAGADCTGIAAQCHGDGNRRFSFNYNDMGGEQTALKQRIQSDEAGNVYTFIIDRDASGNLTNNNNPIEGSGKSKEIPCSGPVCLNLSIDNPAPEYGQTVNLTCGTVPGITQYEFRLLPPNGTTALKLPSTGNTASFTVNEIGAYKARCVICPNGVCQTSDFLPTFATSFMPLPPVPPQP
ncbi:MAG: hypothetical protein COY80_04805 [Candidatus Pacebacteria bacterium CG_4_10_14_0_8_um_filter_42_14]|nr:MAG: hypothetical protein COY80_04805 [Candidatus Pacebacteria bacterium CG_4_10_14_0_8_um_filter_42_14]